MRTTKGREEGRVADAAGPRLFAPKTIRPAPPSDPQRAGFGLGPPAPISARAGEKRASGGATGPIFWRRRPKSRLGGLVGGAAGDALRVSTTAMGKSGSQTRADTAKTCLGHMHAWPLLRFNLPCGIFVVVVATCQVNQSEVNGEITKQTS